MLVQRWANGWPNRATVGQRLGQPLALRRANMMVQRRPDLHLYQGPTLACNVGPTMSVLSGQHWANVCMLTGIINQECMAIKNENNVLCLIAHFNL